MGAATTDATDSTSPSATSSSSAALDTTTGTTGSGTFTFKDKYPAAGSVPVPKPEWVAALDKNSIAKAPVYSSNGDGKKNNYMSLQHVISIHF